MRVMADMMEDTADAMQVRCSLQCQKLPHWSACSQRAPG